MSYSKLNSHTWSALSVLNILHINNTDTIWLKCEKTVEGSRHWGSVNFYRSLVYKTQSF